MPPETASDLPKAYRPEDHEPRVRDRWDASGAFHADPDRVRRGEAPPYCVLIPPPNVTAALHLGHALNNTLQDILVRAHRMMGYETLWMPGTDHAGIATQTVVDKKLRERGEPGIAEYKKQEAEGRAGREAFIEKVQAWKDEFEATITDQFKAMGCSCDWARQRFTMDEVCARAVREAFFRLFEEGLIDRGKRLVNWDPVTQTALADDEVEAREVEGHFYYLRYPVVHPSESGDPRPVTWDELAARGYPGADEHPGGSAAWVTVATTRPETYLGDTAVAVNPRDPRAAPLEGLCCRLPLVGRVVPIVRDEHVVLPVELGGDENDPKARMATGFLKVTPAHDPNDWEIGRRHGLRIINVMAPDASISPDHGWDDYSPVSEASVFVGTSREEARELVVREFGARTLADGVPLLERVEPHRHSVGHSYRSHAPIEPYLSDQWYCRVTDDRLRGVAQRALNPGQRTRSSLERWLESRPESRPAGRREDAPDSGSGDGAMTFHPARYARTYEAWHDELRDWCISRQLWWGHRIPVWSRAYADGAAAPSVPDVVRDSPDAATQRTDDASFVCLRVDRPELVGALESNGFTRDPDVLDTWFSSALWPLSTMGWPDPAAAARETGIDDFPALLDAFNPTSVLCTAREIITLWVSRMAMFNRYFFAEKNGPGPVPFRTVFIHAMIQDGEGRKMSKSLGNGVDPLDIIRSHGADAMRFTLSQLTTHTQDVRLPVETDPETGKNTSPRFDAGRNFCNKLWNAARFALSMLERDGAAGSDAGPVPASELTLPDRWLMTRLARAERELRRCLTEYTFKEYADGCYDMLWRDFCDWYLEAIKPTVQGNRAQQAALRSGLEAVLRLLHPVIPFITETLAEPLHALPARGVEGLRLDPPHRGGVLASAGWPVFDGGLIDDEAEARFERVRALSAEINALRAQHRVKPKRRITVHLTAGLLADLGDDAELVRTLSGVEVLTDRPPRGESAAFVFEGVEHRASDLADAIDAAAERERLEKELVKLTKSLEQLDKRLNNPGYTEKAPAHMVQETRDQRDQTAADIETVAARLEALR